MPQCAELLRELKPHLVQQDVVLVPKKTVLKPQIISAAMGKGCLIQLS
jgi:hypothetical protein